MIKPILVFLIIISNLSAKAGAWGDFISLNPLTGLCNVGGSERKEKWDGEILNKGPENKLCPPYNKDSGREDNTCIVQHDYPQVGIAYFAKFCGEESPDSTYFEPKITMRAQHCNAFACWHDVHDLNSEGECVNMVGGYAFPLHRMCARVAVPAGMIEGYDEDPGYTKGEYLNFEGAKKADKPIKDVNGQNMVPDLPKLCLYRDPSFYTVDPEVSIIPDILDVNPKKQVFHKTKGMHPVVESIVFFINNASSFANSAFSMIGTLFSGFGGGDEGDTTIGSMLGDLFSFLGGIIEFFGSLLTKYIEEVAQINRVVMEEKYGCVNIPMGPYPPPFCDAIKPIATMALTQKICHHDLNGNIVPSIDGLECVVSSLRNNYIHNSIRIGYEKFIPICTDNKDPLSTDLCVNIENLDAFSSAKALHLITSKRDVIRPCNVAAAGEPCVRTMIEHSCNVNSNGCQDGFRVAYGTKIGEYATPNSYFRDDLEDCQSNNNGVCQTIWGVNVGEFVDVSLVFDQIQNSYDILPITNSVSLKNTDGKEELFDIKIVRISESDPVTQDSNEICVSMGDKIVGCQPRAPKPRALIHECGGGIFPGLNCTSSYFNPKFIVSYKIPRKISENPDEFAYDTTAAVIEPLSQHSTSTFSGIVNLIGNELNAFVTDDSFVYKPFSGPNSPNPSTIFGQYQNDLGPINEDGTENENAVYISGLEYINGSYYNGGKYACLENMNNATCPQDPTLCVLTKLINTDTVLCSDFVKKYRKYEGLSQCSAYHNVTCNPIDVMNKIGGGVINIKQCSNGAKCYDHNEELCKISTDYLDRFDPSADLGETLSDSEYYNTAGTSFFGEYPVYVEGNYDKNLYTIRSKTAIERGYCVEVPLGVCQEVSIADEDNGFAYWPEALSGEDSLGTCPNGFEPVAELKRKCVPNAENKTFNFEPLFFLQNDGTKVYSDVKCRQIISP